MKIRIKFQKNGVMRFVGHLDLMRFFQKAIRRAGIDIAYSEGFSPHQIMSFAAPLGVGLTSDGEYLDIEAKTSRSSRESIDALNREMPDGIRILSYVALPDGAAKAMAAVAAADYAVWFPGEADLTEAEISDGIRAYYRERSKIPVTKQTKKSERVIDLKPLIYAFEPWKWDGKRGFFLRLCTGSTDNIKPELVLADFYQYLGKEYRPAGLKTRRLEVYERAEGRLRPLYEAGDDIA